MKASAGQNAGVEVSSGFVQWMIRHRICIVCSSYQSGRLLCIGSQHNGAALFSRAQFPGAMGLAAFSQRIYVGGQTTIWRLENVLRPDQLVDGRFDRLFVPRNAQITGDVGIHEIGVDRSGRIVFVDTNIPAWPP